MGTRGQVIICEAGNPDIVLYQHCDGDTLLAAVKRAISKGQRWNDTPYLTRIIFCEMMLTYGEDHINGTSGFGIQTHRQDDTNFDIIVNMNDKLVTQYAGNKKTQYTFEDMCDDDE